MAIPTKLMERFLSVVTGNEFTYAVGGGVAVNAYGYRRETSDIDAFFLDEDRIRVLQAFRRAKLNVRPIMEPFHYAAFLPEGRSVDERIDLLFPADDPDVSAIEMATPGVYEGADASFGLQLFTAEWLVLAKFYSDRMEDRVDILKLYRLGAFDVSEARRLLSLMDPDAVPDFNALILAMEAKSTRRPRPPRKRR